MKREDKVAKVEELTGKLKDCTAILLADYRGLTVAEARELRSEMRAAGATYEVVKNSLVERAADAAGIEDLRQFLDGPTAVAFCTGEAAPPAKVLAKYAKQFKPLQIKGGILDGKSIDMEMVKFLASLPPKDVLLAQMLGVFQSPARGLVTAVTAPVRGLVTVLDGLKEKMESEAA